MPESDAAKRYIYGFIQVSQTEIIIVLKNKDMKYKTCWSIEHQKMKNIRRL